MGKVEKKRTKKERPSRRGRLRSAVKNLSIKRAFMLYMLVFLLLALLASSLGTTLFSNLKYDVLFRYLDDSQSFSMFNGYGVQIRGGQFTAFTPEDSAAIQLYQLFQNLTVPLSFVACIVLAGLLFYRNRLREPLALLRGASRKIADNDLDFHISYGRQDELGGLCDSFETMRSALERNNRELWRQMEERRRLNAAFSHDLRTPLTVLKGETDLLARYLPQGKVSQEKVLSTVSTMSQHIARLETYVSAMNRLQKLEDIEPVPGEVPWRALETGLRDTGEILCQNHHFSLSGESDAETLWVDRELVFQVFENLLSNALRFAQEKVSVSCENFLGRLVLHVRDDGPGFTPEGLERAASPFYRGRTDGDDSHFGLGLNICKILCEKHGGALTVQNGAPCGAWVTASFSTSKKWGPVDK